MSKYNYSKDRAMEDSIKRVKTLTRNLTIYKLRQSGLTLQEIADKYKLTRQRVYQIYNKYQRLLRIDNGYKEMLDLISIN